MRRRGMPLNPEEGDEPPRGVAGRRASRDIFAKGNSVPPSRPLHLVPHRLRLGDLSDQHAFPLTRYPPADEQNAAHRLDGLSAHGFVGRSIDSTSVFAFFTAL